MSKDKEQRDGGGAAIGEMERTASDRPNGHRTPEARREASAPALWGGDEPFGLFNTRTFKKLGYCIAVVLSATALQAQQNTSSPGRDRGDLDEVRKVSALIGTDVMNSSNIKMAVLRGLALSPDGTALYAVLGCGGVAGIGETYTAAPLDALGVRHDNGKWAVNLDMTAEDFKKVPAMESENCRELMDTQWVARIDQFFPARADSRGSVQSDERPVHRDRQAVQRLLLATKIRSAKLKNEQNVELGKMEDLLLDWNCRAVFAIIGQGGVLGIGENFIPVPWSKLGFNLNRDANALAVVIDASKEQFDKAPIVKGDKYATMLAPGFAEEVRHYFGVKDQRAATGDAGRAG